MKNLKGIEDAIVRYVLDNHPSEFDAATLPRDESLLELGVVDSYGVVELIAFLEGNWNIQIDDAEITRENLGSVRKMAAFIDVRTSEESVTRRTA